MLEIKEGKPYLWRTLNYGDVAVHLVSVGPTGALKVSIDGGAAATPAQRYPELADGFAYTLASKLFRRRSPRQEIESMRRPLLPTPEQVRNVSAKEAAAMVQPGKLPLEKLVELPIKEIRAYAREHYSTIAKLTRKADIIAAIRAQENKGAAAVTEAQHAEINLRHKSRPRGEEITF